MLHNTCQILFLARSFSDIANALSESYGFWLGDAFASGGSAGYDHKDMGITARGAWEAGVVVASAYPGTPSTESGRKACGSR